MFQHAVMAMGTRPVDPSHHRSLVYGISCSKLYFVEIFFMFDSYFTEVCCLGAIDPSQISHSELDKNPAMHHLCVTKICKHVHIFVTKSFIVGYRTGASWDLCNRPMESINTWPVITKFTNAYMRQWTTMYLKNFGIGFQIHFLQGRCL